MDIDVGAAIGVAGMAAGALITIGGWRRALADLERRHSEVAKTAREGLVELRTRSDAMSGELARASSRAELERLAERVQTAEVNAAATRATVEGLRDGIERIEKKIDTLLTAKDSPP